MTPDELEKRIRSEYAEAYREIKKTTKDYFDNLQDRISKQQLRLQRGEIDQNYYKQWLLNQAGRGERYKDLEKKVSDRLIDARKTATAYTNDTTPGVYTLNRNYSAYQIDMGTGPQKGTAWTAWDESTLKRLQTEDRQLVPLARTVLNINKAEKWNKQHIQSALTSAILQGKSVGQLADSFEALALMDRNSSLRNARTALTGAQNAGRQEAYREADEMGITIQKEWICTQDSRTRDTHIELDGQIVDYDQPFETSNGHEIMYPGDPTADPSEVWNCRCTMRAILPKHKINQERVTYKEWLDEHTDDLNNKPKYALADGEGKYEIIKDNSVVAPSEKRHNLPDSEAEWYPRTGIGMDLIKSNIDYVKPEYNNKPFTKDEIIDKIAVNDSNGYCASLSLAYIGNVINGLDITDNRGGESGKLIAKKCDNILSVMGTKGDVVTDSNEIKACITLLENMVPGEEYVLSAANHASIVRNNGYGIEFLELQNVAERGWNRCKDEEVEGLLTNRFGCKLNSQNITSSSLINIKNYKNNREFETILGYINNPDN